MYYIIIWPYVYMKYRHIAHTNRYVHIIHQLIIGHGSTALGT